MAQAMQLSNFNTNLFKIHANGLPILFKRDPDWSSSWANRLIYGKAGLCVTGWSPDVLLSATLLVIPTQLPIDANI